MTMMATLAELASALKFCVKPKRPGVHLNHEARGQYQQSKTALKIVFRKNAAYHSPGIEYSLLLVLLSVAAQAT
jgi:hypothetical protein